MSSDEEIEYITEKKSNKKATNKCNNIDDEDVTVEDSSEISNESGNNNQSENDDGSDGDDESENDNENEDNQPSGAECLSRCKEFASITGTDTALAMFYLQDCKWDLQKGLDAYYSTTKKTNSKVVACFDIGQLNEDEKRKLKESQSSSSLSCASASASTKKLKKETELNNNKVYSNNKSPEQIVVRDSSDDDDENKNKNESEKLNESASNENDKYFKILSWNTDGLDKSNLEARSLGVCNKIINEEPDIIMLQEIVPESENLIRNNLGKLYELITGNINKNQFYTISSSTETNEYYTMILIKKKTCKLVEKEIINFNNSVMGRNLLKVKLKYKKNVEICAMTSHLESTADYSKQRVEQLKMCFQIMHEQEPNCLVFFGGDLNLRDSELSAIGGLPKGIFDMWESTGSRKECLYTWDMSRNTNLKWNAKFKPKCRFDRLYYRPMKNNSLRNISDHSNFTLMPVYFELEGLEKLKSCGRFCSDHWAIQSYCQIELNQPI